MTPLLKVQDLSVSYISRGGTKLAALAGIGLELGSGETLGVLGESGSGKSTLAGALFGMLPVNAQIANGAVLFDGLNLLQMGSRELQDVRGRRIALIVQEPSLALHPTIRIAEQISDILAAHGSLSRSALREKAMQVLSVVFPAEAKRVANSYPHELSGGQRQRVLIGQAIACGPSLIVADEPTASLDTTTQQEILSLFCTLRQRLHLSMIFITLNPALLAGFADRILVLYAGRIVEIGPASRVLALPQHPYTQALLRCASALSDTRKTNHKNRLPVIPGAAARASLHPEGCSYEPRCADRLDLCGKREPECYSVGESHKVSCFRYGS